MDDAHPGQQLADFAAGLRAEAIPGAVLERAEDLMIDWLGSALAGKGARAVETIARFAARMGPADGPSEVLIDRRGSSPLLAAMANAAASSSSPGSPPMRASHRTRRARRRARRCGRSSSRPSQP